VNKNEHSCPFVCLYVCPHILSPKSHTECNLITFSIESLHYNFWVEFHFGRFWPTTFHDSFIQIPKFLNKFEKVSSLEYSDIPKVFFTPNHVHHYCTVIRGYCWALGHSYTNVIRGHSLRNNVFQQ
jgi:hypothetical protein